MSNQAPGLDEYEKSVFLTKAQDEILKSYFNPRGNKYTQGFDDNQKRQIDFSTLVKTVEPERYTNVNYVKFDDRSELYQMPEDILFVLNESALNTDSNIQRLINIVPISFTEYSKVLSRPYKQPFKNQGWRLFQTSNSVDLISEVIVKSGTSLSKYKVRYIRKPKPIILIDLSQSYPGTSIEGITTSTECEVDSILHQEILQRAVELAKAAYIGDVRSTVELGQRSE